MSTPKEKMGIKWCVYILYSSHGDNFCPLYKKSAYSYYFMNDVRVNLTPKSPGASINQDESKSDSEAFWQLNRLSREMYTYEHSTV